MRAYKILSNNALGSQMYLVGLGSLLVVFSSCIHAPTGYKTRDDATVPFDLVGQGDVSSVPLSQADRNSYQNSGSKLERSGSHPEQSEGSKNTPAHKTKEPPKATIYATSDAIFRMHLPEDVVWDSLLTVLLRNYNIALLNRDSGLLTTEWHSYFLNNAVYRNKVSLVVRRRAMKQVEVMLVNNVEKLQDASSTGSGVGTVWLPTTDPAEEVKRIVQNLALLTEQPPPVFPPSSAVARGEQEVVNF